MNKGYEGKGGFYLPPILVYPSSPVASSNFPDAYNLYNINQDLLSWRNVESMTLALFLVLPS